MLIPCKITKLQTWWASQLNKMHLTVIPHCTWHYVWTYFDKMFGFTYICKTFGDKVMFHPHNFVVEKLASWKQCWHQGLALHEPKSSCYFKKLVLHWISLTLFSGENYKIRFHQHLINRAYSQPRPFIAKTN